METKEYLNRLPKGYEPFISYLLKNDYTPIEEITTHIVLQKNIGNLYATIILDYLPKETAECRISSDKRMTHYSSCYIRCDTGLEDIIFPIAIKKLMHHYNDVVF